MKITAIAGHPGTERLVSALMDKYLVSATTSGAEVSKFALRDIEFDPILHEGYRSRQNWEAGLQEILESIQSSDHLLIGFPMWWGMMPASLKGFFDRTFLPGTAFKYHENDPFWDRLFRGKSADVIITADTPGFYFKLRYASALKKIMKNQILGFTGIKPVKQYYFAPVRNRGSENFDKWFKMVEKRGQYIGAR